jgi:hypothetical protein
MLLLLLFVFTQADIGSIFTIYMNDSRTKMPYATIPNCYKIMCNSINDNEIVAVYYLPNRHSDCYFPLRDNNSTYDDIILVGMTYDKSYMDPMNCNSHHDCSQKICLLSNEPSVEVVFLEVSMVEFLIANNILYSKVYLIEY